VPGQTPSNSPPEGSIEVAALLLNPERDKAEEGERGTRTHKIAFRRRERPRPEPESPVVHLFATRHAPSPNQLLLKAEKHLKIKILKIKILKIKIAAFSFKFPAGLPRL